MTRKLASVIALMLLLVLLFLTACAPAAKTVPETGTKQTETVEQEPASDAEVPQNTQTAAVPQRTFGLPVTTIVEGLKKSAASMDYNAFGSEPEVRETGDSTWHIYTVGDGVRLTLYEAPDGMLTTVYLHADKDEWTDASAELMGAYCYLLIVNFCRSDAERSLVDTRLDIANAAGEATYTRFASSSVAMFAATMDEAHVSLLLTPAW